MAIRPSVKISWMVLYCEFCDGRQGIHMLPLHLVAILIYTDDFEQPVAEG
jgi:hypothetical protein